MQKSVLGRGLGSLIDNPRNEPPTDGGGILPYPVPRSPQVGRGLATLLAPREPSNATPTANPKTAFHPKAVPPAATTLVTALLIADLTLAGLGAWLLLSDVSRGIAFAVSAFAWSLAAWLGSLAWRLRAASRSSSP
ncbi:MAG: hypothetical protein ACYC23_22095 [Limisphaerales bacterium]